MEQRNVFDLLTPADWVTVMKMSIAAHCGFVRKSNREWLLQTYTAPLWFAVYFAVSKLDGEIIMGEHFDRWAVLTDSVSREKKRTNSEARLTLVQHGVVSSVGGPELKVPCKLTSVDRLLVYSSVEETHFRKHIVSKQCQRKGLKVENFRPSIELTDMGDDKKGILFIGHPLCEDFQIKLFELLIVRYPCKFYYKPHPTASAGSGVFKKNWQIVQGAVFPKVDLVVSYPSTLVEEYASSGVGAVVHRIDDADHSLNSLVIQISNELRDR